MTRLARDTLVMAERNLVRLPRADMLLAFTVQPIMFVLLFAYVFGGAIGTPGYDSYIDFLIPGIVAQNIAFGGFTTAWARGGHGQGADRPVPLAAHRAGLGAGRPRVGRRGDEPARHDDPADHRPDHRLRLRRERVRGRRGIALLLLFGFASSWIFAVIGLSVSTPEAANGVGFTLVFPITFISSAFVPVESMPDGLEQVADANPFSVVVDAIRALWLDQPAGNSIWLAVVWSLVLIALFAPLAVSKYRKAGHQARVSQPPRAWARGTRTAAGSASARRSARARTSSTRARRC